MAELAQSDHADEHPAGGEHDQDDLGAFLGCRLFGEEQMESGEHGENLTHAALGVRRERGIHRLVARGVARRAIEG